MREILVNIVCCGLFAGVFLIWFIRFFSEMGLFQKENRFINFCKGKKVNQGEKMEKNEAVKVFAASFGIRIFMYVLGAILAVTFVQEYAQGSGLSGKNILESWNKWDAKHYINLAKMGYKDYIENDQHLFLVFFPLYPWILRIVHVVIRNWELASLMLSTVCFCLGSVFFYTVIKEEYGKKIAIRAMVLLSVYPFSFFFGGTMTESLFFCLLSAGFLMIKRHKWLAAGIIGILCSLCRVQGILLMGAGFVELFITYPVFDMVRQKRGKEWAKHFFTKGICLLSMMIGVGIYLWINYSVENNPFQFQVYQKEHWFHSTTLMPKCVNEIINYILNPDTQNIMRICIWLPEIILFMITVILIIYCLRRHSLRYSAFLIVYLMVNYSVTFLISGGRYMACALPLFIFMAEWCARHKILYYCITAVSLLLLELYFTLFLMGQQIM